jgi:hypothetical protein
LRLKFALANFSLNLDSRKPGRRGSGIRPLNPPAFAGAG